MQTSKSIEKFLRYALGSLLALLALNAFAGGYYGVAGAKGIPVAWLKGSPFPNYFIPGLFLLIVVGGSALIATIAVLSRHKEARKASFVCGAIVLLWLAAQVSIIGYVSWMQPATATTVFLIFLLTWLFPKYQRPKEL